MDLGSSPKMESCKTMPMPKPSSMVTAVEDKKQDTIRDIDYLMARKPEKMRKHKNPQQHTNTEVLQKIEDAPKIEKDKKNNNAKKTKRSRVKWNDSRKNETAVATAFPRFASLPWEIRKMIWKLAVRDQDLEIRAVELVHLSVPQTVAVVGAISNGVANVDVDEIHELTVIYPHARYEFTYMLYRLHIDMHQDLASASAESGRAVTKHRKYSESSFRRNPFFDNKTETLCITEKYFCNAQQRFPIPACGRSPLFSPGSESWPFINGSTNQTARHGCIASMKGCLRDELFMEITSLAIQVPRQIGKAMSRIVRILEQFPRCEKLYLVLEFEELPLPAWFHSSDIQLFDPKKEFPHMCAQGAYEEPEGFLLPRNVCMSCALAHEGETIAWEMESDRKPAKGHPLEWDWDLWPVLKKEMKVEIVAAAPRAIMKKLRESPKERMKLRYK